MRDHASDQVSARYVQAQSAFSRHSYPKLFCTMPMLHGCIACIPCRILQYSTRRGEEEADTTVQGQRACTRQWPPLSMPVQAWCAVSISAVYVQKRQVLKLKLMELLHIREQEERNQLASAAAGKAARVGVWGLQHKKPQEQLTSNPLQQLLRLPDLVPANPQKLVVDSNEASLQSLPGQKHMAFRQLKHQATPNRLWHPKQLAQA